GKLGQPRFSRSFTRVAITAQALAFALIPFLSLAASAQINAPEPINIPRTSATPSTILPTDVLPLPAAQERMSFGENLQLRLLQRLPAKFYFNTSVESSFRYETNIFQFPHKRQLLPQLVPGGANG